MQTLIILLSTNYPPLGSSFYWILGPQLLGAVFLIIGFIQYRYPPKTINNWYGYRTQTSQRNQETWDEAQKYSAFYMMKAAIYCILIGLFLTVSMNLFSLSPQHRFPIILLSVIASALAPTLCMLVATEKHLTRMFGDK